MWCRQRELVDALLDAHINAPGNDILPRPTRKAMMAFLVAASEAARCTCIAWPEHVLAQMCRIVPGFETYGSSSLKLSLCKGWHTDSLVLPMLLCCRRSMHLRACWEAHVIEGEQVGEVFRGKCRAATMCKRFGKAAQHPASISGMSAGRPAT